MNEKLATKIVIWFFSHDTGESAKTIVSLAVPNIPNISHRYPSHPSDPSDLRRCIKLLDTIPELRAYLPEAAALSPEWAALIARWDELEQCCRQEMEQNNMKTAKPVKTYELMRSILY